MDHHPNKVIIRSFTDKELTTLDSEFVLPINPEQYAQSFKAKFDAKVPKGAQGTDLKFQVSPPEELKLDFIFDSTGTVYGYAQEEGGQPKSVPRQIKEFKEVVYDLKGTVHQPKYLKVQWTGFVFYCTLTDLQITYTLFSADGTPLRAKLSCSFLNYRETRRRIREEGKSSPDLTHVRTVVKGDTLPLMVNTIYGEPDLYLEVALKNDLTNFRQLDAGSRLFFPPVDKSTT